MNAGIFITQVGASVPTAADYQFIFNSNWPSLAVAFDQVVSISPGANQTLNHNLGFYPFTQAWASSSNTSLGRLFAISGNFQSNNQTDVSITFDKTSVYLSNASASVTYTVNVKCYNLDITQPANYTLPKYPPAKQIYDPTSGIKVTKYGKEITSNDLRDFILHSRAQSPAVLAVITPQSPQLAGASATTLAYVNPASNAVSGVTTVPYIPWAFAFALSGGTYYPLAPGTQQTGPAFQLVKNVNGYFGITVSGNGAVLNYNNVTSGSLVVLRDPLLVANSTQYIYVG